MTFHITEKETKTHKLMEKLVRGREVPAYALIMIDENMNPEMITNMAPDLVLALMDVIRLSHNEGEATVQ